MLWVLGGTFSDFEAQHSDGASNSSRADSLFYGQWSAEPLADGTLGSNGRESRRRLGRKRQERIEALMGGLTVDDYLDDADDDDAGARLVVPEPLSKDRGSPHATVTSGPASGSLLLFDNGFDSERGDFRRRSRFAVVTWDTTTMRAHVSWAWDTGMNTLILGGATRLPTGNVFGTAWPRDVVVTKNAAQHDTGAAVADARYDAVVYETEPTTGRVAWKLSVTSYETLVQRDQVSEDDVRLRHADEGAPLGWAIASAERFYDAPLLTDVNVDVVPHKGWRVTLWCARRRARPRRAWAP